MPVSRACQLLLIYPYFSVQFSGYLTSLPARSHRPRYSPRDCGGTCTTFGLVAPGCVPSSCTSEWFAYTRVSPISTVPRECAQLTRRRLFVAISSPQGDRFRGDLWLVGGGL